MNPRFSLKVSTLLAILSIAQTLVGDETKFPTQLVPTADPILTTIFNIHPLRSAEECRNLASLCVNAPRSPLQLEVAYELALVAQSLDPKPDTDKLLHSWEAIITGSNRRLELAEATPEGESPVSRLLDKLYSRSETTKSVPPRTSDGELTALLDADQADRSDDWFSKTSDAINAISARDRARRASALALFLKLERPTADDLFNVGLIFQHGDTPSDYCLAHELAVCAITRGGDDECRWLAAATYDRFLESIGMEQRFGTQASRTGSLPVDPRLITPFELQAMNCPTQEQTLRLPHKSTKIRLAPGMTRADRVIQDASTGTEFTLPVSPAAIYASRLSTTETSISLIGIRHIDIVATIYYRSLTGEEAPSSAEAWLIDQANQKETQRQNDPGFEHYHNNKKTYHQLAVNQCAALAWTATFQRAGVSRREYFVRIVDRNITALFFADCSSSQLAEAEAFIDQLANNSKLP